MLGQVALAARVTRLDSPYSSHCGSRQDFRNVGSNETLDEFRYETERGPAIKSAGRHLQILLIGSHSQFVDAVVFFVAAVTGNARVLHFMAPDLLIQPLP